MSDESMAIPIHSNKSQFVAFTAVFASLATVLDLILTIGFYGGIWDSWIFLLSPLVGVLLGPVGGFVAIGLGSLIGHILLFRDIFEMLFMIGAPIGAAMAGLIYQRRWKPVLVVYSVLLGGYLIYPVSWALPLFGIWDILVGYIFVLMFSMLSTQEWWNQDCKHGNLMKLVFCTIIGLESDVLTRVFILVPCQTYRFFYGFTVEELELLWVSAGIVTPLKVLIAVALMVTVGLQVLKSLPRHIVQLSYPDQLDMKS